MSTKTLRMAFAMWGVVPLIMGILLFATAGIKGFDGTGGDNTLLFQMLGYAAIVTAVGGVLAILMALKLSRRLALVAGIMMILPGLFLFLVYPMGGLPILILGILMAVMSRMIPKKPKQP